MVSVLKRKPEEPPPEPVVYADEWLAERLTHEVSRGVWLVEGTADSIELQERLKKTTIDEWFESLPQDLTEVTVWLARQKDALQRGSLTDYASKVIGPSRSTEAHFNKLASQTS